ncbi:MAG: hypothetical protein ACWA41_05995 [Putridiphycobacter sp.]
MNRRILILFLLISGFVQSQDIQSQLSGEWFSCNKRDFNVGDTIILQRDSCIINYEHNGNNLSIQVSFEFSEDHFSIYKNSGVVAGGTNYNYWKIKNDSMIYIGFDENDIHEEYKILVLESDRMTLIKKK